MITEEEYNNLPSTAKPFFALQNGNAVPLFEPEQVKSTQEQLQQEATVAKQEVISVKKTLEELQNALPERFQQSSKELSDYFTKLDSSGATAAFTALPVSEQQAALDKKLRERDKNTEERINKISNEFEEQKKALEKENNKLKASEVERMVFGAMRESARKNNLNPKYDEHLFQMNRSRLSVNKNELIITDEDGLPSGVTVDKFFADLKENYGEMFTGTGMSGSGATTQRQVPPYTQGRIGRNNLELLNNMKEIAKGNVKVI